MAKRKLDMLLAEPLSPNSSVKYRLAPAKLTALNNDMKELIAVERKGRVLPPHTKIAEYVESEYQIRVQPHTVSAWLKKIRKGGSIA